MLLHKRAHANATAGMSAVATLGMYHSRQHWLRQTHMYSHLCDGLTQTPPDVLAAQPLLDADQDTDEIGAAGWPLLSRLLAEGLCLGPYIPTDRPSLVRLLLSQQTLSSATG